MTGLRFAALALAALVLAGCTSGSPPVPLTAPTALPPAKQVAAATLQPTPAPSPTPKPLVQGPSFVLLRAKDVTADARLNFMGQGFAPGEPTVVTIEDSLGAVEKTLEPIA